MTKKSVVVKRLTAVEDLGSLQVLASDKTGTLTENKLKVSDFNTHDEAKLFLFANLASYFSDSSRNASNNAFDLALKKHLGDRGKNDLHTYEMVDEIPFDPNRKRFTAFVKNQDRHFVISRGSAEEIMSLCSNVTGSKTGASNFNKNELEKWILNEAVKGRRCNLRPAQNNA